MRTLAPASLLLALASLTGCLLDSNHDGGGDIGPPTGPSCTGVEVDPIDLAAPISYVDGEDAGYYITNNGSAWHLEWTCDTHLSDEGCEFSGVIYADAPADGSVATCYKCETEDSVSTTSASPGPSGEPRIAIQFDTITTTAIDGVDFSSVAGATLDLNLQINGLAQPDLVFFVSGGAVVSPTCSPFELAPTT